ncbi:hypothetical protein HYALB_00012917, partial [Hymenoscyphus albidus]
LPNRWRRPVATVATQTPKNSQYCTPTQFSDEVKDQLMVLLGEGCLPTDTPSPEDEYKDLRALHQTYVEHCAKNQILGYTRFADGKKESRDLARSPPTFEEFQALLYHFMRRQETPWGLPPLLAVWKTQIWDIDSNTRSSRLRRYCGWIGADASRSDAAMLQDIVEWRENNLSQLDIRVFNQPVAIPLRAVDDPDRNQDPNSVKPTDRRRLIFEQDEEVVMYGPPMVKRAIGQDSEVYRIVIDLEGNAAAVPLSVIDRLSDLNNANDDKGIKPFDMILGRPPQRVQRYEESESSEDDDNDGDSLPPSSNSEEISDGERTPEPCAPPHARNPHATWSGLQGSDEEEEEEEDDDDDDEGDPDRSQSEGGSSRQQTRDSFDEADGVTPEQYGDDDGQGSQISYEVSEA